MRSAVVLSGSVVAALAASANADFFVVAGMGDYMSTGTVGTVIQGMMSETLTVNVGPYTFATSAGTLDIDTGSNPDSVSGSLVFTDGGGDTITISLSGSAFGTGSQFATAAGTWTMTSGTGAFSAFSGSGTWNTALFFQTAGSDKAMSMSKFGGDLVPAPGAAALMALGGLVAIRRRR